MTPTPVSNFYALHQAPGIVDAAAAGPNALMVTWSGVPSSSSGSAVASYRIEVYTSSPTVSSSGSTFGQASANIVSVRRKVLDRTVGALQ